VLITRVLFLPRFASIILTVIILFNLFDQILEQPEPDPGGPTAAAGGQCGRVRAAAAILLPRAPGRRPLKRVQRVQPVLKKADAMSAAKKQSFFLLAS
jgi:hypothetical protein